jgi:hypothetical protein
MLVPLKFEVIVLVFDCGWLWGIAKSGPNNRVEVNGRASIGLIKAGETSAGETGLMPLKLALPHLVAGVRGSDFRFVRIGAVDIFRESDAETLALAAVVRVERWGSAVPVPGAPEKSFRAAVLSEYAV